MTSAIEAARRLADPVAHAAAGLLDTERMAASLGSLLDPTELSHVAVEYVRYKPFVDVTVLYRLELCDGSSTRVHLRAFPPGRSRLSEISSKWSERRPPRPPFCRSFAVLSDPPAVAFVFPLDAAVRGLATVTTPREVKRLLDRSAPEIFGSGWSVHRGSIRTEILRYKPESRCVVACDLVRYRLGDDEEEARRVVLKAFAKDDAGGARTARGQSLELRLAAAGIEVPHVFGYDALRDVAIHQYLDAPSLHVRLAEGAVTDASDLGSSLARWQRSTRYAGRRAGGERWLEALERAAEECARAIGRRTALDELLVRLRPTAPRIELCEVHGDLHSRQILLARRPTFIDLDRCGTAPDLWDLSSLAADLLESADEDGTGPDHAAPPSTGRGEAFRRFLADLLRRYAAERERPVDPAALRWTVAAAFAIRSLTAVRRLEPSWSERIERGCATAHDILAGREGALDV